MGSVTNDAKLYLTLEPSITITSPLPEKHLISLSPTILDLVASNANQSNGVFGTRSAKVYKQSGEDPGNPGLGSLSFFLHISSSIENAVKTTDLNDVVVLSVLTILNRSQLSSTVFLFQYIDLFLKVAGKKIWGPVFPVQDVQCQLERAVEITCFRKMDKLVHIICGRYHILCF